MGPRFRCIKLDIILLGLVLGIDSVNSWISFPTFSLEPWCNQVENPPWPFAYQKHGGDPDSEAKGRTASDQQFFGEPCTTFGTRSICHLCTNSECRDLDASANVSCHYQLQGADWDALPKNIPTVTDVPFSVANQDAAGLTGLSHRYDYANAERICLLLDGGECMRHDKADYTGCSVKCWGANNPNKPFPFERGWTYSNQTGDPQGQVSTVIGNINGTAGYVDGPAEDSLLNRPSDVAVDHFGNLYIADTGNNVIRFYNKSMDIIFTIAGVPLQEGFQDGNATNALFRKPSGIAIYFPPETSNFPVIYIADTGNHVIRVLRVVNAERTMPLSSAYMVVETIAGGGENLAELIGSISIGGAGFADGYGTDARFDNPRGISVSENGRLIFVADMNNHVIRFIEARSNDSFFVGVLAGTVVNVTSWDYEVNDDEAFMGLLKAQVGLEAADIHVDSGQVGCPPNMDPLRPLRCLVGLQGIRDGIANEARFTHPYSVAVGPVGKTGFPTLVVADQDRIRVISGIRNTSMPNLASTDARVVTLAGGNVDGDVDGAGDVATFDKPRGVYSDNSGRVIVSEAVSCRLRQLTPASLVAQSVSCETSASSVASPQGCSSYDPPVDAIDRLATASSKNVVYNFENALFDAIRRKECLGSPPLDFGLESTGKRRGSNGGTVAASFTSNEDTGEFTTIRISCPPSCLTIYASDPNDFVIEGNSVYSDRSSICLSAIHNGVIDDDGGMVSIRLRRGVCLGCEEFNFIPGNVSNGVLSNDVTESRRNFDIEKYLSSTVEVHTISGAPSAPLATPCGLVDSKPPTYATFNLPMGIAAWPFAALGENLPLSGLANTIFIADQENNVIRNLRGGCSTVCENGGVCVTGDRCSCPPGWTGSSCSTPVCNAVICDARQLCTAPETCTCVPGYTGFTCEEPLCVQTCDNGGICVAPDTCACTSGWFDSNCTTPVCSQTCGNGGNCIAPDLCMCEEGWTGRDCRTPVCDPDCQNNGTCVAPNTCRCDPFWSGIDCSLPVCHQGFFLPKEGGMQQSQFVPCKLQKWCDATDDFECLQAPLLTTTTDTGLPKSTKLKDCSIIEIDPNITTQFRYFASSDNVTSFMRNSRKTPFPEGLPETEPDRQLALVSLRLFTEGRYACANSGNCVAPDTCACSPGWTGFDCRIPICRNGYFDPERRAQQWNYFCSLRPLTIWENFDTLTGKFPGSIHEHPNFFSIRDDSGVTSGWPQTHILRFPGNLESFEGWRLNGWFEVDNPGSNDPPQWRHGITCTARFRRKCVEPNKESMFAAVAGADAGVADPQLSYSPVLNFTDQKVISQWRWTEEGGECIDEVLDGCFNRGTCAGPETCTCTDGWEGHDCSLPICKQTVGSVRGELGLPSTLLRGDGINVGNSAELNELELPRNPGDLVIQYRKCPNSGNCTLPGTCVCERGWSGEDCSIPLCAQECMNGGKCIAPDTCYCPQWANEFRDSRGQFYFRRQDDTPQQTGWTGYDCNTPICVQAERWLPNVASAETPEHLVLTFNNGTHQAGCNGFHFLKPLNRTRVSSKLCGQRRWFQGTYKYSYEFRPLDNDDVTRMATGRNIRVNVPNYVREEEDIDSAWTEGPLIEGEGIYACYNGGSCVAPDKCVCRDGWSGYDCNTPTCQFSRFDGTVSTCKNGAMCGMRNSCTCPRFPSHLPEVHPEIRPQMTGYTGSDCSVPICAQGWFDEDCSDVDEESILSPGRGCYRCPNGGICTLPDRCTCPSGWTGYDCRTPSCTQHATEGLIEELDTVDPLRIQEFELDPCGTKQLTRIGGEEVPRGNCTGPNVCTCFCRIRTGPGSSPWSDPFGRSIPKSSIFGRFDCESGFEGKLDSEDRFSTCHLRVYEPTWIEENSLTLLLSIFFSMLFIILVYAIIRRKLKQRHKAARAARRRRREAYEEGLAEMKDDDE